MAPLILGNWGSFWSEVDVFQTCGSAERQHPLPWRINNKTFSLDQIGVAYSRGDEEKGERGRLSLCWIKASILSISWQGFRGTADWIWKFPSQCLEVSRATGLFDLAGHLLIVRESGHRAPEGRKILLDSWTKLQWEMSLEGKEKAGGVVCWQAQKSMPQSCGHRG